MKLMKKLINKGRLFTEVVCIGILFSFCANSATINVIQGNAVVKYTYNNIQWTDEGGQQLNAATLRRHLMDIKDGKNIENEEDSGIATKRVRPSLCVCIRELSRMLLAQIPAADGTTDGPHNVAENNDVAYITPNRMTDVYKSCGELKKHLLEHGHLGYFPMISVQNENLQVKVNKLVPRGIFNLSHAIMEGVCNAQFDILKCINNFLNQSMPYFLLPIEVPETHPMYSAEYPSFAQVKRGSFHLLPNLLNNLGFKVDPAVSRNEHPNLEDATNNLISYLLSTDSIKNVQIGRVEGKRFTLDVEYNFPNPIPDTTQTNDIGYKMDGTATNTVRIVVQVQNGKISIVTMYPLG